MTGRRRKRRRYAWRQIAHIPKPSESSNLLATVRSYEQAVASIHAVVSIGRIVRARKDAYGNVVFTARVGR